MSTLQIGADELLLGLDQVLWGGAAFPHPHSVGGEAALVHTVARLQYPNDDRLFLWSGPYTLTLPSEFADLRAGRGSWNQFGGVDYSTRGVPSDVRITGAAHDPVFPFRVALISSVEQKFWHNIADLHTFVEVDLSTLTAPWLPAGHVIYPVGGATILEEGTLVLGCWAGPPRTADDRGYNGFLYEGEGRWCIYHHRLREPGVGGTKAAAMPVNVGDTNIQAPFPRGVLADQHYDLVTLHAVEGRNLTAWKDAVARFGVGGDEETLDENDMPVHTFPYSDDEVVYFFHTNDVGRDEYFTPGYHMSALNVGGRSPDASWETSDAYPIDAPKVRAITGAPSWANRLRYASMADDGKRSWWVRRDAGVDVASSLVSLAPGRLTISVTAIPGFQADTRAFIPLSAFPEGVDRPYRALVPGLISGGLLTAPEATVRLVRHDGPSADDYVASARYAAVNPSLVSVAPVDEQVGVNDTRRVSVSVAWPGEINMGQALQDPGPVRVEIDLVWSPDAGATWHLLDRPFTGVLSLPTLAPNDEGGFAYQFEVATHDSDVDRGETAYWTNASQQAAHPGDRFFEGRDSIDEGARLLRWPPL